eukprot:TRINITY_DN104589_c0_g1_i1.p1 TRINITY_DN104589_c0_g1~~TRINITY_DN104589_c0_g1_i1.p1  ORF type:complete len:372 (-),score=46.58 TRINITY_DN104589_c0_g1_i1:20-1135(-)
MALAPGKRIFIQYDEELWHERLLLVRVGNSNTKFVIYTPDSDMYVEDFAAANEDISDVRVVASTGERPPDVENGAYYAFAAPVTAAELERLQARARGIADVEAIRDGVVIDLPGVSWIAVESGPYGDKGMIVAANDSLISLGDKGIMQFMQDGVLKSFFFLSAERGQEDAVRGRWRLDERDTGDARTLPIIRMDGKRRRPLESIIDDGQQVDYDDWVIRGPRTVAWCLEFLRHRGGPMAHHEWWKSVCRLSDNDYGVLKHDTIMRAVEYWVQYDQLDLVNIAGVEQVLRRAQLVEHYHRSRGRGDGGDGKDRRDGYNTEESQAFLGTGGSSGHVMLNPDLLEFVSKELERQASIDKQARKAKEERALRAKK